MRVLIAIALSCFVALPAAPLNLSPGSQLFGFGADQDKDRQGEQVLARYLAASGRGVANGFSAVARFVGRLPKMKKSAELSAKRHTNLNGNVEYTGVIVRSGDSTVQKDVIARFMSGEVESSSPNQSKKDRDNVAINTENYKFKYKGLTPMGSSQVHVFELNPRKKRVGLFKGELWIDAETGLTVREAGRFVKSPSIFLKKVDFAREFAIVGGVSVPKSLVTSIQTRFWGMAELEVHYSDITWDPGIGFSATATTQALER